MNPAAGLRLRRFILDRRPEGSGWTLDLSERLGVSRAALMAWLAGREPSLDSIGRLARELGCERWRVLATWDGDGPTYDS